MRSALKLLSLLLALGQLWGRNSTEEDSILTNASITLKGRLDIVLHDDDTDINYKKVEGDVIV